MDGEGGGDVGEGDFRAFLSATGHVHIDVSLVKGSEEQVEDIIVISSHIVRLRVGDDILIESS